MRRITLLFFQGLAVLSAHAYVFTVANTRNNSNQAISRLTSRSDNPADFGWVRRWAVVGDSFSAGIGAGAPLGNPITDKPGSTDWYCSRYDGAYPMIVNDALGSSVEDFQFLACSGDRSGGIYNQIKDMKGDLDLVMMTAGGNDLCLSRMIDRCVFRGTDEGACQGVIDIAQSNLDSMLKSNLEQLLDALDEKMNKDSVVVFNGYAQYFNTENEDCADKQDWILLNLGGGEPLTLTVKRRKAFNDLVVQINNVIKAVVKAASKKDYKFTIGYSDWGAWVSEGVDGQYCDPASTAVYPDPKQPDLQFFKPNTVPFDDSGELFARDNASMAIEWDGHKWALEEVERRNERDDMYNEMMRRSVNPQAAVAHQLARRFPSRSNCPGDKDVDVQPPSIGLPDSVGKNFHPNELGHYTIASFALQTMIDLRAKVLGKGTPSCDAGGKDQFTCWQKQGSKQYASEPRLNANTKDFCDSVKRPSGKSGWEFSKTFDKGTPDETEFKISLDDSATNFDKKQCEESISRIINSCDGNDPDNPMDWKFGGEWVRDEYTYQVNPQRKNRPWPVIQKAEGSCKGWWHALFSSYTVHGRGWADYDYGQQTLQKATKGCIGSAPSLWKFKYFDEPDSDGMEWKATFNTPVFVRKRCFKNNKVAFNAGGFTDGCGGND